MKTSNHFCAGQITKSGEDPAIESFKLAAKDVPHYRDLLASLGVDVPRVVSLSDFQERVPLLRKKDVFADHIPISRLCRKGEIGDNLHLMISSGFSGESSFSMLDAVGASSFRGPLDIYISNLLSPTASRTLIVNALGMGVRLPPTQHSIIETGVRSDLVIKALLKFGSYYDQTLIVGDPNFLKKIVDEGNDIGLDWRGLQISLLTGGDWVPETMRTYFTEETGIDPENPAEYRGVFITFGLTELGLNVFFETQETIKIRRCALNNDRLRRALFYSGNRQNLNFNPEVCPPVVPNLFHYDPTRFFIETVTANEAEAEEFVFTTLSAHTKIPLIRYVSGDLGALHSPSDLQDCLRSLGMDELIPQMPLPLASPCGRSALGCANREPRASSAYLSPEELRHGLYSCNESARSVTGHFTVTEKAGKAVAHVQLRPKIKQAARLNKIIGRALSSASPYAVECSTYEHDTYPYGRTLNYEVKFNHVGS